MAALAFVKAQVEFLEVVLRNTTSQEQRQKAQANFKYVLERKVKEMRGVSVHDATAMVDLISKAPVDQAQRAACVDLINDKMCQVDMVRGATSTLQKMEHMHNYLNIAEWRTVGDRAASPKSKLLLLANRCDQLGLCHPSERSVADIVALVFGDEDAVVAAGTLALDCVRSFKTILSKKKGTACIADYPEHPSALQETHLDLYQLNYPADSPPAPCPLSLLRLKAAQGKMPCRSTKAADRLQPARSSSPPSEAGPAHRTPWLLGNQWCPGLLPMANVPSFPLHVPLQRPPLLALMDSPWKERKTAPPQQAQPFKESEGLVQQQQSAEFGGTAKSEAAPAQLASEAGAAQLAGEAGPAQLAGEAGPAQLAGEAGPATLPSKAAPASIPSQAPPANLQARLDPQTCRQEGPQNVAARMREALRSKKTPTEGQVEKEVEAPSPPKPNTAVIKRPSSAMNPREPSRLAKRPAGTSSKASLDQPSSKATSATLASAPASTTTNRPSLHFPGLQHRPSLHYGSSRVCCDVKHKRWRLYRHTADRVEASFYWGSYDTPKQCWAAVVKELQHLNP